MAKHHEFTYYNMFPIFSHEDFMFGPIWADFPFLDNPDPFFFHPKIPTSSQGHSSGCDATSARGQAVRRLHHRLPALRRGRQWSSGGMSAHHTWGSLDVGSPSHLAFNSKSRSHLDLIGGLEHLDYFSFHIWDVILPIDELHHFSEG